MNRHVIDKTNTFTSDHYPLLKYGNFVGQITIQYIM